MAPVSPVSLAFMRVTFDLTAFSYPVAPVGPLIDVAPTGPVTPVALHENSHQNDKKSSDPVVPVPPVIPVALRQTKSQNE